MRCGKRLYMSLVAAGLATTPALAASPGADLTELGGVGLGRAGAMRAARDAPGAGSAAFAAATLDPQYVIWSGGGVGADQTWSLRAGAMDARTSPVSLGFGYERRWDDVPPTGEALPGWVVPGETLSDAAQHNRIWLAAGVPLLDRRLSLAVAARYDWSTAASSGDSNAFDVSASLAASPVETLTIAVEGRDLVGSSYRLTGRALGLGVGWRPDDFVGVYADVVTPLEGVALDAPFTTYDVHFGVDLGLVEWLRLRGGASYDEGAWRAAGGIGLTAEKVDFDYGVRLDPGDPLRSWHGIDLTLKL